MDVATIQFMSDALWRRVTYTALLPNSATVGAGPYPVLYQLHGGNQSHTDWLYYSRLLRYLEALPFIVILPDGAQSRWANNGRPFEAYETFLIDELAQHVTNTFHVAPGKWAIGGNSMGGFGAVRLGLTYPDRFFSIWSHSGAFPTADTLADHWYWAGAPESLDCYALLERLDPHTLPRLGFDCGTDDHLLESNRRFHSFLEARSVPHSYTEHEGGHTWEYWDAYAPDGLRQHYESWRAYQAQSGSEKETTI